MSGEPPTPGPAPGPPADPEGVGDGPAPSPAPPAAGSTAAEPRDPLGLLLALGVLLLACGALLSDALLSDRVLSQADALEQFAPWSDDGIPEGAPSNGVLLDQAIVMQPWLHFGTERVQAGTAPWWNPDNYLGQPMVGTYQTAYFWPLHWLAMVAPGWWFLEWSALLRLVAAGAFTYLFLRRLALARGPAILGGVVFALCGFQVAWLGHMHTHVSPLLPALLWAVERVIARDPARPAAAGRRTALLALLVGGALLAGHLQTALHVAMAVGAWTLARTVVPVGGRTLDPGGLGRVAGAAALGVLLAMPQLLPFFEYLGDSRGAVVLEEVQTVDPIAPSDAAILLVDPGAHGSPAAAQGYGPYTGPAGSNVNYNELVGGYVGVAALGLTLVGLWTGRRRREVWVLGGGAVLAACIAWQVPGVYDVFAALPKLKSTKLMRFAVVLAFALACLAAFGLEGALARFRPMDRDERSGEAGDARTRVALLDTSVVALVLVELLAFGRGYNPTLAPEALAPPTAVTDFLQDRVADQPPFRVLAVDNTTLLPSANLLYGIPMVGGYDSMELATTADLVGLLSNDERGAYFVKEIRKFDRTEALPLARLLGVRYVLSPIELPPPYELRLDGPTRVYEDPGVAPRLTRAERAVLRTDREARLAVLGAPTHDPGTVVLEALPAGVELAPTARAALEAGEAVDVAPLEGELVSYGDLEVVVRVTAGPSALDPGYDPALGASRPDLQGTLPALVRLADAWDAGWVAELDGVPVPVERVDHGLRGVVVPPGEHELVLRYAPRGLRIGLLLGLVGALGLLVLLRPQARA